MPSNPYARPHRPPGFTTVSVPVPDEPAADVRPVPAVALDMADACRALDVSDATLRELIRGGIVPAIQVGRRWLIPIDALRQRLAALAIAEADRRQARPAADADADAERNAPPG